MKTLFTHWMEHLRTPLLLQLKLRERLLFYAVSFVCIALSVLVVHQLLPEEQPWSVLIFHASVVSSLYCLGLGALESVLLLITHKSKSFSKVAVYQIWGLSFIGFILGFIFFEILKDHSTVIDAQFQELHPTRASMHFAKAFFQLMPFWAILTFFFVQIHLKKTLLIEKETLEQTLLSEKEALKQTWTAEKEELQSINRNLEKRIGEDLASEGGAVPQKTMLILKKGKFSYEIDPQTISHVCVEDHYCTLFIREEQTLKKVEVQLALSDVLKQLPKTYFLHIHRSHAVNVQYIAQVKRESRSYTIYMERELEPLAVSRHRLPEVLPQLKKFLL